VTAIGGAQAVPPGDSGQLASVDLEKGGTYLLLCGIPNAEGVPHLARGMIRLVRAE
jgi:hypothetical protein